MNSTLWTSYYEGTLRIVIFQTHPNFMILFPLRMLPILLSFSKSIITAWNVHLKFFNGVSKKFCTYWKPGNFRRENSAEQTVQGTVFGNCNLIYWMIWWFIIQDSYLNSGAISTFSTHLGFWHDAFTYAIHFLFLTNILITRNPFYYHALTFMQW